MREREQEAATAVKKLVGRYFPKILEDYDVYLTLKDWEFNKELYFLTLRKKKENRTRKEFE